MQPDTLFYIIITILILNFIIDKALEILNLRGFKESIPEILSDVYDNKEYQKSQAYKKINHRFGLFSSSSSLLLTLIFLFLEGFAWVDNLARSFSDNNILIALIFFGIISIGSDIITSPFSYYKIFVIEEKFGFNKTTKKTFFQDKIKGSTMTVIFGGFMLGLIILFYDFTGKHFWLYTWGVISLISLFMNMFYSKLIVPLFNKQIPLEDGELKNEITKYTSSVGFKLNNIFIINGSKRSTKANAYFTGFGTQKRVALYDTLLNDLTVEEIVSVLAHEVGHYKRKHIFYNLITSILLTGITLFILSLFINTSILSISLGVSIPSFHISLIAFGILYTPISKITGLLMNYMSRRFEYQADNYAKDTFASEPLVSSLKKLSKNSLSNLTPHPLYVFFHYSHPTLFNRIQNLKQ
tara:strand:- start:5798 stop:7030 length:1233 start_codon:yes stop_codon:yes gene_type:complete